MPPRSAAFFGRAGELAEIAARLANPACRLLTALGPGGMGKTLHLAFRAMAWLGLGRMASAEHNFTLARAYLSQALGARGVPFFTNLHALSTRPPAKLSYKLNPGNPFSN